MRLTLEQRLVALERDNVVLHDTIKLLHKLLKEQRELISDYITLKVTSADPSNEQKGATARPEDALYTFVCKQRFDRIEKDMGKLRNFMKNSEFSLKAG
jgi:uncharacterized coiled-coil protein SlyX